MTKRIVIIGGGLVGLATGFQLSQQLSGRAQITIVEAESEVAFHQSGRNSGVIHSGVYYSPGTLKVKNCIAGRALLIDFCERNSVPYRICGKLIVATEENELPYLTKLRSRGISNGINCIKLLPKEIQKREPSVTKAIEAIFIEDAGVTDFKVLALKMKDLIIEGGHQIRLGSKVVRFKSRGDRAVVETTTGEYDADLIVNAAGLHADRIMRLTGQEPPVRIIPFRGEYYTVSDKNSSLCRSLIYPVPNPRFPFLGVHFSRGISGIVEAGPNAVLALKRNGYSWLDVSLRDTVESLAYPGLQRLLFLHGKEALKEILRSLSKRLFLKELRKLVPSIAASDLVPGRAGVRAQAVSPDGSLVDDFLLHRQQRFIHVLNAPSPAATSCLSIGRYISEQVKELL